MKFVLHIGAHKTATTSIQRTLARNRARLLKSGVWYPKYSEIFPGASDHYAHLDLAKGLMSDSRTFTPERVEEFFAELPERARKRRGAEAILISAEPFYRGSLPGEGPFWERRERYVARLQEILPFTDVEVVLVLRRHDDYLESLYNEHVKVTRYAKDIWSFLEDYRARFEYRRQIELWSKYFPVLKVFTFEELVEKRTPTQTFLEAVFGPVGVAPTEAPEGSNVSLPVDLVEFKRLLNGTALSRPELREVVALLESVAQARGKAPRTSRLSVADRRNLLAQFADDNDWVNKRFCADRPGGLFPADIKEVAAAPELGLRAAMDIVAEILKGRLGSGAA